MSTQERRSKVQAVAARDGWWCVWCGCPLIAGTATLDHWRTRSVGGNHDVSNLRLACGSCNQRRGDMVAEEWSEIAIFDLMSIGRYWRAQPETTWIPLRPICRANVGTVIERGFGDRPEMHDELGGRVVAGMVLENGPKAGVRRDVVRKRVEAGVALGARHRTFAEHNDTRWSKEWRPSGPVPASPKSRRRDP